MEEDKLEELFGKHFNGLHYDDITKEGIMDYAFEVANAHAASLIDYIENNAEIAMPINELMHEDGRHLSKKEYGKVLLKYLVKELRIKIE
jgi:hypothetical protein